MTLARFADFIGRYSELPVVDLTGLRGSYEMEFDVSGDEGGNAGAAPGVPAPPPPPAAGAAGFSLASSLRRLGLKLESRKAPVEVLVIDKVDKVPTTN